MSNPDILKVASSNDREDYYFAQYQWGNYWIEILTHQFRYISFTSFLGALLIALFWGYYLYQFDIFNTDPIRYMLICFAMAALLTYTGWFLYKIFHFYLESDMNGNLWNDLFYSIFTIGLIEEVLKVIPLLMMIFVFKKVHEPYDYIKYACTSALGFAFIENIMYLDRYGLNVMDGRFIFAGFGHIFDSCIIGYALAVNKFRWKKPVAFIFPLALLSAAIIHGIYDFFLISNSANSLWIFSIIIIILSLFLFHGFINNTLNNSTYFNKAIKFPTINIISYSIGGSFVVLGAGYILSAVYYGTSYSFYSFISTVFSLNTFFVAIFLVTLNSITLIPNGWLSVIHFFRVNKNRTSSGLRKGNTVHLLPFSTSEVIQLMFPAKGEVVRSYKNQKGTFYLIKLTKSYPINTEVTDHVIITLKEERTMDNNIIGVFLIKQQQMLQRDFLHMNFIQYVGWARLDFEIQQ